MVRYIQQETLASIKFGEMAIYSEFRTGEI
jgi:hypothetical protein